MVGLGGGVPVSIGCPNKVLLFVKSPKFDYQTFRKILSLNFFVNDPKIFQDDKILVFSI